jgi:hypothetical protein
MIEYLDHDIEYIELGKPLPNFKSIKSHYPVINEVRELVGIVGYDDLQDWTDSKVNLNPQLIIDKSSHILIAMMRMKELDSDVLFLTENGVYLGAISFNSIVHYFQDHLTFNYESAFLTLSVSHYAFSLTELSRIAESEGTKILYFTSRWTDSENLEIDVVFDSSDLKRFIGIMENKGYKIINFYNETGMVDHLKSRYENLMTYLNV